MTSTNYLVVSDIHSDPRNALLAMIAGKEYARNHLDSELSELILAGDIGETLSLRENPHLADLPGAQTKTQSETSNGIYVARTLDDAVQAGGVNTLSNLLKTDNADKRVTGSLLASEMGNLPDLSRHTNQSSNAQLSDTYQAGRFIDFILDAAVFKAADLDIDFNRIYCLPGNHEPIGEWNVVERRARQDSRFVNCASSQNFLVEKEDHQLILIPGTDPFMGGFFALEYDKEKPMLAKAKTQRGGDIYVLNIFELAENIKQTKGYDPMRTVAVSHNPAKFDTGYTVDLTKNCVLKDGTKVPYELIHHPEVAANLDQVVIGHEGSQKLTEMYNQLGIMYAVSGHFHDAGPIGHDSKGDQVSEGTMSSNLHYTSGSCDSNPNTPGIGHAGIIAVCTDSGKVQMSYHTLEFKLYDSK